MLGRSVATTIGFIGGILVLLGGLLAFLMGVIRGAAVSGFGPIAGALGALLVAAIFGFLIVFTSRPRFLWWPGRRLFNGVLLVVLGVLTWFLVGGSVLVEVGAILAILAGILLPFEGLIGRPFRSGRRIFHRRAF